MRSSWWFLPVLVTVLLVSGCVDEARYNLVALRNREQEHLLKEKDAEIGRLHDRVPSSQETAMAAEAPPEAGGAARVDPRRVIYTGVFQVVVSDVKHALARTKAAAARLGGYMQQMTEERIVFRVPAERFDEAVETVEGMGTVVHRQVEAQDVTEEYEDLGVQLENARALAATLRKLLDRAKDVEDALAVEKELARVRERIERLEGRLNRLKNRIAYATLSVTFRPTAQAPGEVVARLPFPWLWRLGLDSLMQF